MRLFKSNQTKVAYVRLLKFEFKCMHTEDGEHSRASSITRKIEGL